MKNDEAARYYQEKVDNSWTVGLITLGAGAIIGWLIAALLGEDEKKE